MVALFGAASPIQAQHAKPQGSSSPYPTMAPVAQYRMDRDAEIALARTAAPASISRDAEIMVLGEKNFEVAVPGKNGFVCAVGRAFAGPLNNPEFWNPKNRSPICYNPAAARSLWPYAVKQTGMALAGSSKAQITEARRTAVVRKDLGVPFIYSDEDHKWEFSHAELLEVVTKAGFRVLEAKRVWGIQTLYLQA